MEKNRSDCRPEAGCAPQTGAGGAAWEPKIIAFLCNWCSYAGADLAGTSRLQYPANIRVIRVPCSGRINPIYILKALLEGADGVMVSGCHPGDCHYLSGNLFARRRFVVLKKLLTTVGLNPERVQFTWVSASEGGRFAQVIAEVTENVKKLGPSQVLPRTQTNQGGNGAVSPPRPAPESAAVAAESATIEPTAAESAMTGEMRALCKKLLQDNEASLVLAYERGGIGDLRIPCFVKDAADVDKIEWNSRCFQNLAPYLHGRTEKTAIVAKPCDVRAIIQYITEQQLKREDVIIIGVDCAGMEDENGQLRPGCGDCRTRKPPLYDYHIQDARLAGENPASETGAEANQKNPPPEAAAGESLEKNFEKFKAEIDKCILCYACRQACYGCYCKDCFIERDRPDWQPAEVDTGTKMTFHLGRAMHLAGRCVECGACEASCASGVNLRYIIQAATDFIAETYAYRAGLSAEQTPALLTNAFDDREIGFLGGETHG